MKAKFDSKARHSLQHSPSKQSLEDPCESGIGYIMDLFICLTNVSKVVVNIPSSIMHNEEEFDELVGYAYTTENTTMGIEPQMMTPIMICSKKTLKLLNIASRCEQQGLIGAN